MVLPTEMRLLLQLSDNTDSKMTKNIKVLFISSLLSVDLAISGAKLHTTGNGGSVLPRSVKVKLLAMFYLLLFFALITESLKLTIRPRTSQ